MIPANIQKVLDLLSNLQYVLFKCEHIINGKNKNVDILLSDKDYQQASLILEQQRFILYLPERVEKYKRMYVYFDPAKKENSLTTIHLHREVAWHGLIALTKKPILERARNNIPSPEDSLLIHVAHAIFENFAVNEFQRKLLEEYKLKVVDYEYINKQLQENGWKKEFTQFLSAFTVSKGMIIRAYLKNFSKRPTGMLLLSLKAGKALLRTASLRRKGYLIALVGMNGTGKTTLQQELLNQYTPLTNFVSGQYGYYFGWNPTLFSKILAKSTGNKKIFEKVTTEIVEQFNFFQEGLFLYIYFEYLWRYYTKIYPQLRKNHVVISDRYFYDMYGQYPYSQNSFILPLLYFPKPDALFVLDADVNTVMKRDKTGKEERRVQPMEKLQWQKRRYLTVAERKNGIILDAQQDIEKNKQQIIEFTWRGFVQA